MKHLLLITLILLFQNSNSQNHNEAPNFIFILADDQGWNGTSVNMIDGNNLSKSDFYETPNIDRIAYEGTLFTQGYANASVCSPSRASLLTGLYPTVHGITDWIGAKYGTDWRSVGRKTKLLPSDYVKHLPFEMTTLAEVFKTQQYKTFFAGKWHLGSVEQQSLPTNHGFEINKF